MQQLAKRWDKDMIQALLDTNQKAVEHALLAIYKLQTPDEKSEQMTAHRNGIGFSKHDAEFCSDVARKTVLIGRPLSSRQLAIMRNKMKRYWRQLVAISNGEDPSLPPKAEPVSTAAKRSEASLEQPGVKALYPDLSVEDELAAYNREIAAELEQEPGIMGLW